MPLTKSIKRTAPAAAATKKKKKAATAKKPAAAAAKSPARMLASDPVDSVADCGQCKSHSLSNKKFGKPESEISSSLMHFLEERDSAGGLLQRMLIGRHQFRIVQLLQQQLLLLVSDVVRDRWQQCDSADDLINEIREFVGS
jgi:hypothetical protein